MSNFFSCVVLLILSAGAAFAQTTEFTYSGRLNDGANSASGNYDSEFLYGRVGRRLSATFATGTSRSCLRPGTEKFRVVTMRSRRNTEQSHHKSA